MNSNTARQIHRIIDITSTFPLWHDWIITANINIQILP